MRYAETIFHDATCGPLMITERTDVTEPRYVCVRCKQMWREAPVQARIKGETRLVYDDDFLRGFAKWNSADWFFLTNEHDHCEKKAIGGRKNVHPKIIGGRLVNVCWQCGAVWEAEVVTE